MSQKFKVMDELFESLMLIASDLCFSKYIRDKFMNAGISFFYSNIIVNIFTNISESNYLNDEQKLNYKERFKTTYEDANNVITGVGTFSVRIDRSQYILFKRETVREFPSLKILFTEIEEFCNLKDFGDYVQNIRKNIKFTDKSNSNLEIKFKTYLIEEKLRKDHNIIIEDTKSTSLNITQIFEKLVDEEYLSFYLKNIRPTIKLNKKIRSGFETRLLKKWNSPLSHFDELLELSLFGVKHFRSNWKDEEKKSYRYGMLVLIHSRSLRIGKEILTLLRSGYSDGAHARWRSLHELDVISAFLAKSNETVSERYHYFQYIIKHERLKNYNKYIDRLNEEPFSQDEIDRMNNQIEDLKCKYNNFRYDRGWGWIPVESKKIMGLKDDSRINLHNLEEYVGLDHMSPYYNWASDSIHGNSTGFHALGSGTDSQTLIGPSNIGLTDPLHASALSIWRITMNVLFLEPNIFNMFIFHSLEKITTKIGNAAIQVERSIKKDEDDLRKQGF